MLKRTALLCTFLVAACSPAKKEEAAEASPPTLADAPSDDLSNEAPDVRLYAMDCGRIGMLDLGLFANDGSYDGRENQAADMCFLIRHPDGNLMWDAGLPEALNETEGGITNGAFHVAVPVTVTSQLGAIGIRPSEIEYFSVSHSHFDHVGNAAMFAGSTFLVDKDERTYMFRDAVRADPQSFDLISALEGAQIIEFDGDYDVFGDGSVKILAMPGHTPGHTSLLVNLKNTGPVMLTGDLYHLLESREKRLVPRFNVDADQTLASMDNFEALAKETGARVIVQHSLEHMNELPLAPEYLD